MGWVCCVFRDDPLAVLRYFGIDEVKDSPDVQDVLVVALLVLLDEGGCGDLLADGIDDQLEYHGDEDESED